MGIIISAICLLTPKVYVKENTWLIASKTSVEPLGSVFAPKTNWDLILTLCIPVLVIGGLLVYSARKRK